MRNEASEAVVSSVRAGAAAPRHVAIIMDGNGRWAAAQRPLASRIMATWRGVEALRRAVRAAGEMGISWLTVYSFSSENWRRPAQEVSDLMGLLKRFIRNDLADLHANGVRVKVIGLREGLAPDIRALLEEAEELTRRNGKMTLVVAFNYGARQEIAQAVRAIARKAEPDLIIRTSGEQRLSNFLLWQAAYSEFVFLDLHWPDFDRAALEQAVDIYHRRERRFGGVCGAAGSNAMTGS